MFNTSTFHHELPKRPIANMYLSITGRFYLPASHGFMIELNLILQKVQNSQNKLNYRNGSMRNGLKSVVIHYSYKKRAKYYRSQ